MKLWRSRLPVRLARSGPSALLDITIIVLTGSPQVSMAVSPECMREHYHTVSSSCPCVGKRERFVQWALDTLAGENGETCKRWKRLHIVLGPWIYRIDPHQSEEDGILLRGLTYPTPALTEVHMGELSFALTPPGSIHRILPHAPILQEIHIRNCDLPGPLPLWSVKKISISRMPLSRIPTAWKPANLRRVVPLWDAASVKSLSLHVAEAQEFQLGFTYPKLIYLELLGSRLPRGIKDCIMPHLRHLSIDIGSPGMCRELLALSPGFLSQITTLEAWIEEYSWKLDPMAEEIQGFLRKLLRTVSSSLTSFWSTDTIVSIVLKLLWESGHGSDSREVLVFKQNLVLSHAEGGLDSIRELKGDESPAELEELAQEWPGISSPDQEWNVLLDILERSVDNPFRY